MLACYYAANPAEHVGDSWDSQAGRCVRIWLERQDLIGPDNKATERGKAWVEYICDTPLPEMTWVRPERGASND
jgi:hypothetical protein